MLKNNRPKAMVLLHIWASLLGVLVVLSSPVLAEDDTAKKSKPPPLPAIQLPPPPAESAGAPLAREANERVMKSDYEGALPLYREAWEKGERSQNGAYNSACAAAVTGHLDEAFIWLARSAEAGWRDTAHLEVDADLDPLREDPRFIEFVQKVEANARSHDKNNNSELRLLVEADQAVRQNLPDLKETPVEELKEFWERLSADDARRRARVVEIISAGGARTGDDYFAAALVYQHGDDLDDFAKARDYAAKAVELGNERGRWLAAAAWDRWLVNAGYPQRFGTQYMCSPDCELREWDESTTNEERARWNVPPLEEAKKGMDGK